MIKATIKSVIVILFLGAVALPILPDLPAQTSKSRMFNKIKAREDLVEEAKAQMKDARAHELLEEALRRKQELVHENTIKPLESLAEEAAVGKGITPEQQEREAVARAMLERAKETVSDEAAKLLQESVVPAAGLQVAQGTVPIAEAIANESGTKPLTTAKGEPLPAPVLDRQPQPLRAGRAKPVRGDDVTEIDAKGGAYFHSSQKIIIFTEDVNVAHPTFDLQCDKLEIFLYEDSELSGSGAGASAGQPAGGAGVVGGAFGGNKSIKRAIATGYVVITKTGAGGDAQVGKARHATFESASGDVILRDYPQVQRGSNLIIATDRTTTIVLRADGNMEVHGPSKTEIVKEKPGPASQ